MESTSINHISRLDVTSPGNSDAINEADNHLRFIKASIKATFPNIIYTSGSASEYVNATAAELNVLDGYTGSTADLNVIAGANANGMTSAKLTNLAGVTATATEINNIAGIGGGIATTYATLASPALTGTPTAPTQATSDNSTAIATTAYVKANNQAIATFDSANGVLHITV
tara:strand:+ start:1120 stop:1635 length:516 start_codon:yes stop_codon:yes gene_type:complete